MCTEMGSCANSAQMISTVSGHNILNSECRDICLVKIHSVLKEIFKFFKKAKL